jgi:hypothetical protein
MMFAAIRIAGIVARMVLSVLVACLRRLTLRCARLRDWFRLDGLHGRLVNWLALPWRLLRRSTGLRLTRLSVLPWWFLVMRTLLLSQSLTLTLVLFLPPLSVLAWPDKQLEQRLSGPGSPCLDLADNPIDVLRHLLGDRPPLRILSGNLIDRLGHHVRRRLSEFKDSMGDMGYSLTIPWCVDCLHGVHRLGGKPR